MHSNNVRRAIVGGRALLLQPERRFWLIVGLITLGGAALRVLVHDFGLPYIEDTDELWLWLRGQQERAIEWPNTRPQAPYPPLSLSLHVWAQLAAEAQGRFLPADAILDLRRVILAFNIAGTVFMAQLGRQCGGIFAGLVAATLWAFHPVMLDVPLLALGDSLSYPLFILSLLLAVLALDPSRRWLLAPASMGVAALVMMLEFRLVVAFLPGAAALALRTWNHHRPGPKRLMLWIVGGGTIALLSGAIVFQILPSRFQGIIHETLFSNLWDLPALFVNLQLTLQPLEAARRWKTTLVNLAMITLCSIVVYCLLVRFVPGMAALAWHPGRIRRPGLRKSLRRVLAFGAVALVAGAVMFTVLPDGPGSGSGTFWRDSSSVIGLLRLLIRHLGDIALAGFTAFLLTALIVPPLFSWRDRAADVGPPRLASLLLTVASLIIFLWAISSVRPYGYEAEGVPVRHLIPAITLVFVLLGVALAQTMALLHLRRWQVLATTLLAVYALSAIINPSLGIVRKHYHKPWPAIILPWANENLDPATILAYYDSGRWFHRIHGTLTPNIVVFDSLWGGIPYRPGFAWHLTGDILERPLREWIETHNITWLALPVYVQRRLQDSAGGQALLAQLLPLREFTGPPARRGVEIAFYRLWRMQHESDVRFGEHIRLVGYDLHNPDAGPGDALVFTLYWNALTTPPENYSFFLHLVAGDDPHPLAGIDGNPAVPERLTQTWEWPDETLISPRFSLTLPSELAPGDHRVLLGLYDVETAARLPVLDAQGISSSDAWELLRLNISDDGTATVTETTLATH